MKNANTMVQRLPLQYLFSKAELKHYAIEQVYDFTLSMSQFHNG
jgi:hypothetical protein